MTHRVNDERSTDCCGDVRQRQATTERFVPITLIVILTLTLRRVTKLWKWTTADPYFTEKRRLL